MAMHTTMRVVHPPGAAQAPTMHLWMIAANEQFLLIGTFILTLSLPENKY